MSTGERRYVDEQGRPVNENGRVLLGVEPMDSPAYVAFIEQRAAAARDPGLHGDSDRSDEALDSLAAMIDQMPDAGEREEARARLDKLSAVLSATPARSAAYAEAVGVRVRAADVADALENDEERLAVLQQGVADMLAVADRADTDHADALAIRSETHSLYRMIDAIRSGQGSR